MHPLAEFLHRGQAAQAAVDALGAGRPAAYWWHVRMRVIERDAAHVEVVSAPDARQATRAAMSSAGDKWRGCSFAVIDVLQEGV
jgi:hypothetical protein